MEDLFSREEVQAAGHWPVAPRYHVLRGTIYPYADLDGLPGPAIGSGGRLFRIAPLAEPDAFLRFARLAARGEPSEAKILEWVHRFGLLYRLKPRLPIEVVSQEDAQGRKRDVLNQKPMTLAEFREESRTAYRLLKMYEILRDDDTPNLRALFEELELGKTVGHEDGLDAAQLARWGQIALGLHIDKQLEGVRHYFSWSVGFAVRCPDVRTALYWQFACLVSGKRRTGICTVCGEIFERTRVDRQVCGPGCRSRKCRNK